MTTWIMDPNPPRPRRLKLAATPPAYSPQAPITDHPECAPLQDRIRKALENFPEALDAVLAAFRLDPASGKNAKSNPTNPAAPPAPHPQSRTQKWQNEPNTPHPRPAGHAPTATIIPFPTTTSTHTPANTTLHPPNQQLSFTQMPELPEVEAVASRIRQDAQGAQIASVEIQRPRIVAPQTPDHFRQLTENARLTTVERRGKHLILRLSNANAIHIHLRISGNVRVVPDGRLLPAATRLTLHLRDGRAIILEDARALARASALPAAEIPKLFEDLGPEPLSPEFTPGILAAEAARSRQPAKLFLMDQKHLAGLGNVYAAEALFRAGIHPLKPMNKLGKPRIAALHAAIV